MASHEVLSQKVMGSNPGAGKVFFLIKMYLYNPIILHLNLKIKHVIDVQFSICFLCTPNLNKSF